MTTHAVIGALIGSRINNPPAAFFISFAAHFIIDAIPHEPKGDMILTIPMTKEKRKKSLKQRYIAGSIDSVILLLLTVYLFFYQKVTPVFPIFAGICGGVIPDFIVTISFYIKNKYLKTFFNFHNKIHLLSGLFVPRLIAITYQAVIVGVSLYIM